VLVLVRVLMVGEGVAEGVLSGLVGGFAGVDCFFACWMIPLLLGSWWLLIPPELGGKRGPIDDALLRRCRWRGES
jgi:hypothetical protein